MKYIAINKIHRIAIAVIILLFAVFRDAQTQIQEEFLPQTQTFREMALRLDVLENNFQSTPASVTLEQLLSIRQHCETILPRLSPADRSESQTLIYRTLLLESVLHYYAGEMEEAEAVADELLSREPSMTLTGNLATPEVAEWFENIREKHTGFISVISTPPGAMVLVDGIEFGLTPLEDAFAPVGDHIVEVSLDGYLPFRQNVTIVHQHKQIVSATLQRNSGGLFIWVSPPGTTIAISSLQKTVQSTPAMFYFFPLIQAMGFDPFNFSQPVYIPMIPPGESTIRLEKPCRQPISYNFNLETADYYLPLVVLPQAESMLRIHSSPSGQNVYADNEFIGTTPLLDAVVCPGERTIRVEFSNGATWMETHNFQVDTTTEMSSFPRPAILFLGCVSPDKGLGIEGEAAVREWLKDLDSFSLLGGPESRSYRLRPDVATVLEQMESGIFDADNPEWLAKVENMVASLPDTGATVLAFGRLETASSVNQSRIYFMHRDSTRPDVMLLPPGMPSRSTMNTWADGMTRYPPILRLRSGIRVTEIDARVVISQIIPGGPAETSPLQAGDIIVSMNGANLSGSLDFRTILENPDSPESMPLIASRGNRQIETTIGMKRQPMIAAIQDARVFYNLLLARLEIDLLQTGQPPDPVLIQAGNYCLGIGRPDRARDFFNRCNLIDSDGFGIGTLAYLKYLSENALHNPAVANQLLKTALNSPGATIIHGDGPWLRDLLQ